MLERGQSEVGGRGLGAELHDVEVVGPGVKVPVQAAARVAREEPILRHVQLEGVGEVVASASYVI